MTAGGTLPGPLQEVVQEFAALPPELRLEALLEYSELVPALPAAYAERPELLERVHECQTPFFVATELDEGRVRLHLDAPVQAPTTRGFAGILHAGLDGATAGEVLAVPGDLPARLGLIEALSPLRARGISAILAVVQRQIRALATEAELGAPAARRA
ncbi:MAG: SufE family protein [Solirubrobacteraceae bacterium]